MAKKYEGFSPVETAINPRADLSIQERKECEEKIKLGNMLIDTGYNRVLQKVKILRQVSPKQLCQLQEVEVTEWYIDILKL